MKRYVPLFVFLAFLGICAALFNSFYGDAKKNAIAELNSRQILHARQAAQSIEQYFDSWLQTLERLARNDHIIALDAAGKKTMGEVYNENRDKIRSITRVDRNGRIIDTVPFSQYAVGIDISYQQHVREIMRTHKPVVSEIFTTVQGFESIAVLVPMFKEGSYDGSIGILLKFREVARRYLEDIKIGETGYAWMITSGGIELYCPVQGHVGNSVFENCKDFPSIIAMAREMIQGKQGTTTYTFDKIRHDTVTEVTKHAVYMPINVGSTF
jgi:hypothetical protein